MAFATLHNQSLQWLLEIGVTIHYQISLTQHQVAIGLYRLPSFLICPIFEIACTGDVLSQPPIHLRPHIRANTDVKYEDPQSPDWLYTFYKYTSTHVPYRAELIIPLLTSSLAMEMLKEM